MDQRKLSYRLDIYRELRTVIEALKNQYEIVNTSYLDHFNDICPGCRKPVKHYRGEVRELGTISIFQFRDTKHVVPHILCKTCGKKRINFQGQDIIEKSHAYIKQKIQECDVETWG